MPPHYFSALETDHHEWQSIFSSAKTLHRSKLPKGGLSFLSLIEVQQRIERLQQGTIEEHKKSSVDDEDGEEAHQEVQTRKSPRRQASPSPEKIANKPTEPSTIGSPIPVPQSFEPSSPQH